MENKNFNNEKINNNGYGYVDLDLPSGTLWATANVGANKPSDSGKFFQWGDTQGYKNPQIGKDKRFCWTDYKWNPNGDGNTFTKYDTIGATLKLVDDAAHANMGGDWHIPSPAQIRELIDNTKKSFTILCGVKGMKFTSKKDSSKSIFIPAVGYVWNDSPINVMDANGYIWASMLSDNYVDYGQHLTFYSGDAYVGKSFRQIGLPVRGVIDKNNDKSKGKKSKKNDELNLVEILKNVPKGTKLWSPLLGECEFVKVVKDYPSPIICKKPGQRCSWYFKSNGRFVNYDDSECVLFPSKENMNWETFNVPTHKHFEPFQKVLCMVVNKPGCKIWSANFYSHYDEDKKQHYLVGGFLRNDDEVIPYKGNEDKLGKPSNN